MVHSWISALVIGSFTAAALLLAAFIVHALHAAPAALRQHVNSISGALGAALRLGATAHIQALDVFTHAMAIGYRVIAVIVLIGAVAVALGLPQERRFP